jgi:hypothetical protein
LAQLALIVLYKGIDANPFLEFLGQNMTNGLKKMLTPDDLEYLTFEQAASICCISEERFAKWVEKGLVPVIELNEKQLVRAQDLIQHLIRHNIRIPERLLQGNIKKVLFILMQAEIPHTMTTEIIWGLYKLRKQTSYIFDFIEYDENTELKIITFDPNYIFLLQREEQRPEVEKHISKMLSKTIPIHSFSTDREINFESFLTD